MANSVSMEALTGNIGSIYKLVMVISKRAKELSEGAPKLTEYKSDKPIILALHEVSEGKITYKKAEAKDA